MRRLLSTTAIALSASVAIAILAPTASGQFQLRGHEATQTFVVARYIEVRAVATVLDSGLASMDAEAAHIEAECPRALAKAPASAGRDALATELLVSLEFALLKPMREPLSGFAGAMVADHLRWRDGDLQRLVYAYVHEEKALLSLHQPTPCADARAWAASHYTRLPAGTRRLLSAVGGLSLARNTKTERQLLAALRRHTTKSEQALLERIARIQVVQVGSVDMQLESAAAAVAHSLGIRPPDVVRRVIPPYASAEY